MIVAEKSNKKILRSENYNYNYNKDTGYFERWGKTTEPIDDPQVSPFGPEILDLEISSGGDCQGKCPFCYKCNGEAGDPTHNMTFEEFKIIFDKMPKILTQIAFGIMDIQTNPDFFKMMEYAKEHGVAPNYTCHGLDMTPELAKRTAGLCGAVAVSLVSKTKTFNTIKMLLAEGMRQVNIHYMLSEETYDKAFEIVNEISADPEMKDFNAIVFLQYKSKGRNPDGFHSVLDTKKYKALTDHCESKDMRYGFDSCSGPIFIESIKANITPFDANLSINENYIREFFNRKRKENEDFISMFVEPCESGLFSSYINCYGEFFVCSFAEDEDDWKVGLDALGCEDFLKDIWHNPRLIAWRERLLLGKRACPIYDLAIETV